MRAHSCTGSRVCKKHLTRGQLPKDKARQEANCVHSEWPRVWRQRRRAWSAAQAAARAVGEDTSSESESSGGDDEEEDEDEEEGEVTPPPHSSPTEDLPSLSDLFSQQEGISIDVPRS
jgi:hypothetical protein